MKKMILCCLVAVLGCGVFAVEAKTPQKKGEIVTTVFTVDIDCESCAARIMNNVPVIGKGIKDIQVDVPSKVRLPFFIIQLCCSSHFVIL